MITATHIPTEKTVEITGITSDGRVFIRTIDGSEPFSRYTMGGPANFDWSVVQPLSLKGISVVTLPCPHLNTHTNQTTATEYGEAVVRETVICADCGAEVSEGIAGLACEMELEY